MVSVTFIWFLAPKLKPLRRTWSSHCLGEVPGRFGCFRNLNRTLGPTRPILSFTPFASHGVNRTLPCQKPFWRGMPSFNFRTAVRLCPGAPADAPRTLSATAPATGQTRLLAVLTPKTRIRPISLPTRQQKRPFPGKTLPCRSPNRPHRQSDCQHGRASNRIPPLDLVQPISGHGPARFWARCLAFPKLKPHFGPQKANFVVYPLLWSRGKPHPPLPGALLLGYAVVYLSGVKAVPARHRLCHSYVQLTKRRARHKTELFSNCV